MFWTTATYYAGEGAPGERVVIQHKAGDAITLVDFQAAKIEDLQNIVQSFRRLIDDVRAVTARFRTRPPTAALRNSSTNSGNFLLWR